MTQNKIEILYFEGCPNYESTKTLVDELIEEMGIEANVVHHDVKDNEEAVRLRFLGSPSVRVNDKDIELDENDETEYSMSCRIYKYKDKRLGSPPEELVRKALSSLS